MSRAPAAILSGFSPGRQVEIENRPTHGVEADPSGSLASGLALTVHDRTAPDDDGVEAKRLPGTLRHLLRGLVARGGTSGDALVGQHVESGAIELEGADLDAASGDEGAIGDPSSGQTVEREADPVAADPNPTHPFVLGNGGLVSGAGQPEGGLREVGFDHRDYDLGQRVPPQDQPRRPTAEHDRPTGFASPPSSPRDRTPDPSPRSGRAPGVWRCCRRHPAAAA